MMAIDKVVSVEDKGKEEPVPPPPRSAGQEVVSAGDGSCQKACNLDGCSCEGFRKCIGRSGHRRRPHRCSFLPEVGSTSSSSREPGRASIEGIDGTAVSGLEIEIAGAGSSACAAEDLTVICKDKEIHVPQKAKNIAKNIPTVLEFSER